MNKILLCLCVFLFCMPITMSKIYAADNMFEPVKPSGKRKTEKLMMSPIQLSFSPDNALFNQDRTINGLYLGLLGHQKSVNGLALGFASDFDSFNGVYLGGLFSSSHSNGAIVGLASFSDEMKGIQLGLVNIGWDGFYGMQGGLINVGDRGSALQLGVANLLDKSSGIQFGLVNGGGGRDFFSLIQLGAVNLSMEMKGIQLAGLFNGARDIRGLQVAPVNYAEDVSGVQLGICNFVNYALSHKKDDVNLLNAPVKGFHVDEPDGTAKEFTENFNPAAVKGAQIGVLFNQAQAVRGVQIAIVNYAEQLEGLQIGCINIHNKKDAGLRILPVINFSKKF